IGSAGSGERGKNSGVAVTLKKKPKPRPRASTAAAVKPGLLRMMRQPDRRSWMALMSHLVGLPHPTRWPRRKFLFSSRRRHTRLQGDWSSDVCSSDLEAVDVLQIPAFLCRQTDLVVAAALS